MIRPRTRLLAALAIASVFATRNARVGAQALPQPDADDARLAAISGTRGVEMTFWFQPGRPGIAAQGTSTIRPNSMRIAETGSYVEIKYTGKR
jgi:hypothetical protein